MEAEAHSPHHPTPPSDKPMAVGLAAEWEHLERLGLSPAVMHVLLQCVMRVDGLLLNAAVWREAGNTQKSLIIIHGPNSFRTRLTWYNPCLPVLLCFKFTGL